MQRSIEEDVKSARLLINRLEDEPELTPATLEELHLIVTSFEDTFNRLVNAYRAIDHERDRLNKIVGLAYNSHALDALASTLAAYNSVEKIRRSLGTD